MDIIQNNKEQSTYYAHISYEHHSLYLAASEVGLCFLGSQNGDKDEMIQWFKKHRKATELIHDYDKVAVYAEEVIDYLKGDRQIFTIPIDINGTVFQNSVWKALLNIPYGTTVTYTGIANNIDKPKSVRAVGTAIGANPILIVIPCHRVIAKDGKLSGFRGGIEMKKELLKIEGKQVKGF